MMHKRWRLKPVNDETVSNLQLTLPIHNSLLKILAARNISTFDEAQSYFRPTIDALHDPFLMKGMQIAVDRILLAMQRQEKILLYGDYDVDGTTSVAVVFHFIKHFYEHITYYIPNRFKEGYGVSAAGIQHAIDEKIGVIITVDCGIKSVELIHTAQASGIDVIICDHHLPGEVLPNALSILNAKQADCAYPYKELCGCGVGYKLICALEQTMTNEQHVCNKHLDLVATAIAADIVPITGENRIIAFFGLQKANEDPCIAIQALKQVADVKKEFTISDLVFIVAPRVNAAGRMDDARLAVDLFLSTNIDDAKELAGRLNINNDDRKDTDKQMTAEALDLLLMLPEDKKATVLYRQDWHKGVVGIIASRMIEHRYQPTIILTESNGKISGSARSIPGLNLFEALNECAEYLENYGGHYFAAGLTMKHEYLEPFIEKFCAIARRELSDEDFQPIVNIDAQINFEQISEKFYSIVHQMEPYGPENLRPVFLSKQVMDYQGRSAIVKEKHVKFHLVQDGKMVKGIGFNLAHLFPIITSGEPFDICYTIEPNTWNDITTIEIKVLDIQQHCDV
jgi:single-stranded-DNA-specific exonuclease